VVRELLVPDLHRQIIMLSARFLPGQRGSGEATTHAGEECVVVLEGEMEIEVNGRVVRLNIGDSFYFESTVPHMFRNPGEKPAEILVAITARGNRV